MDGTGDDQSDTPAATPTSKTATRPPKSRRRNVLDAIAVFTLSAVAVMTAWCGSQSSKWGGEMSIAFSEASSARVQAADAASEARDARASDQSIWVQWVLADQRGDIELVSYIEDRFTPEFRTAFDAWNTDGRSAAGPFATDAYVPPGTEEAAELSARADRRFSNALENNQRGDNYSIVTVLFALVLFLTAMSQRELQPWVRRTLLALAVAVGILGVAIMLTYPVRI